MNHLMSLLARYRGHTADVRTNQSLVTGVLPNHGARDVPARSGNDCSQMLEFFARFDCNRICCGPGRPALRVGHALTSAAAVFLLMGAGQTVLGTSAWTGFRGPWGNGHAAAAGDTNRAGIPLRWSETEHVRWKTPLPYRGWSTPVVMEGQVWVTTATEDGHEFFAICVDADTGKVRFQEKVFHCEKPEPLGNDVNCYATPSAALERGRVWVHYGSYGTACLDTKTGKSIWKRDDLPCRHYRGPSSSPVLFENLVILTFDGADLQYSVGLDKATGKTVWKTNRSVAWNDEDVPGQMARDGDLRKAHSTPLIATVAGKPQLLSVGAKAGYGYDPRTGRELWRVRYDDWSVAPVPLYRDGLAYFVTGLVKAELLAIKADAAGDVTDTHVAWRIKTRVCKTASPLLVDDLIYMLADESFVSCVEAKSGDLVWTERIGGKYAASPIYADGRLYFFDQEGNTTVLKPGRQFEVLATNKLDQGFMASPAVAGKALYLRTRTHLYRVEE
jgi:outer membrane protein assembly factor BamB